MPEIKNSERSLWQATYTPIKVTNPDPTLESSPTLVPTKSWEKWSFFASLDSSAAELEKLAADFEQLQGKGIFDAWVNGTPNPVETVRLFHDVSTEILKEFARQLIVLRKQSFLKSTSFLNDVSVKLIHSSATTELPSGIPLQKVPENWQQVKDLVSPHLNGTIYRNEVKESLEPKVETGDTQPATGEKTVVEAILVTPKTSEFPKVESLNTVAPSLSSLLSKAVTFENKDTIGKITTEIKHLGLNSETATVEDFQKATGVHITNLQNFLVGFEQRMEIEPIGFLHLERIGFTPAGIEQGELVYSLPLAPDEEVSVSHKEWANTSEEFEKIVTDFLEEYSEEGVTEKTELSQASNSQNQHSSGFNTGVTASGGYGPVNITATAGYNVNDSSTNSEQFSRNQSLQVTRKASARTRKEHKISFKVVTASGTEDQTVRRIKNPFHDKATRVDYYQLVRKWKVDLYRHGIRLTYDLVIPEPGSDILSKIKEIQEIRMALETGFDSPGTNQPWARFDLRPDDISRYNYLTLADQYNASVEPPPEPTKTVIRSETREWTREQSERSQFTKFEVEVPENYEVSSFRYEWTRWAYVDDPWHFDVETDFETWFNKTGKLPVVIGTKYVTAFFIEVQVIATLKEDIYQAWKMKVWTALRDAAQARFYENRQMLKERLSRLTEELGAQDALSLRKIEREEVMKGVLRWLFGPSFKFVPQGIPVDLYGTDQSVISEEAWGQVLAQGEIIKFLHHAIEWENMLYFLYPYFWSHTSNWDFKKYLDHPDSMHRVFLKSGSARVVLTIRPGYERDFVSFLETGTFNSLPADHPYLRITEEMENYAKTNFPGIPAANPIADARPLIYPKQKKAWEDMQRLMRLLDLYYQAVGSYPTTAQGLAALKNYTTTEIPIVPERDPWNFPYVYTSPGTYGSYDLVSYGADGKAGGTNENADITSWAEASQIGTWYEYTPTSAMDIVFNETLPRA